MVGIFLLIFREKGRKYGVTINSKNHSIDLSYSGFYRLRKKVAELTKPDIYEHYKMLNDGSYALIKIKGNEDFSHGMTEKLKNWIKSTMENILRFSISYIQVIVTEKQMQIIANPYMKS